MTTTTQRILDLAAAAPAARDEDLVLLLDEANELYQQGLKDLHRDVAARLDGLLDAVQLGVALGVGRLLPGLGALEVQARPRAMQGALSPVLGCRIR